MSENNFQNLPQGNISHFFKKHRFMEILYVSEVNPRFTVYFFIVIHVKQEFVNCISCPLEDRHLLGGSLINNKFADKRTIQDFANMNIILE